MTSPIDQRSRIAGPAKIRRATPIIHRSIALMVLFHFSSLSAAPDTLPSKKAANIVRPMANIAKTEDICSAALNIISTNQKESTNGQSLLNRLTHLNQSISATPKTIVGQDVAATNQMTHLAATTAKDLRVFGGYFSLTEADQALVKQCVKSRALPQAAGASEAWTQISTYRIKLEVELDLILNPPKNKQWLQSADAKLIAQLKDLLIILQNLNQAAAQEKGQPYSCDEPN